MQITSGRASGYRHCLAALALAAVGITSGAGAEGLVDDAVPMRWLEEYTPEALPELKFPAYFSDLDKAREQVFRGRYKTALLTLNKVRNGDPVQVAVVKASAQAQIGKVEDALRLLSEPATAKDQQAQVLKGRILLQAGRLEDAITHLKAVVADHADSVPARYYLGEAAEMAGDLELAKEHYGWIHKTHYEQWQGQGARVFEDAHLVTLMGRAFDRHATLNGMYANNAPLNNTMLRVFVQAYDVIDREYWPGHLAAAEFYFARSNPKEAEKELRAALEGNPQDIRAIELMGLLALEQWNFDGADAAIASIRKVNRNSPDADLLEARNLLQQRRPEDAEKPLGRVLAKQPKNLSALGLLAGAYALQLKEDKVQETLKRVEQIDPDNATAYYELAEQLSALRQYPRAEQTYRVAIERAHWWTAPRNGLGLLLTQSGDEDKAKVELDLAYSLDPFNFRTTNYLILLDKMAKMARSESDHFIVIYDAQQDPMIPEYFNEYLESIYKEITGTFKHEPPVKTLIEVFAKHDAFSVRTTGSPWIGTVGASTGRVIAMVAPRRGENTMGPYNWAQVLRHEYVHTVTLSATENRIGHWMTEGLAVYAEHSPLRWEWVPMLHDAVTKKELFSMENLTWAFVRPRRPQDRSLAYAQSYWICKYIADTYGHDKLLKMMAEFKSGKSQEEVFRVVLSKETDAFETEFFAWTEKQVAGWGYDKETSQKYEELSKKGQALIDGKQYDEALEVWQEIVKLRPVDQLPHQRLAFLYRQKKDHAKAVEHLTRLHEVSLKSNIFAKGIARMHLAADEAKKAEPVALDAVYIDPYDLDAHKLLLSIAEKTGNEKLVTREKRVIPVLEKWIEDYQRSTLMEGAPQP